MDDLQLIDDLCDRFEAALRDGTPISIESCLDEVAPPHREKLLRELLEIEIDLSAQKPVPESGSLSQQPILLLQESLKERFPEKAELIDGIVQRVAKLRQIGDYEILEELGHGGMGIVFKARQKLLNQTVAIKVLAQTLLDDPHAVGRFRREMQLIGRLNHPNIVRALNAGTVQTGEWEGSHYLVMEFVDGITLQHLGSSLRKARRRAEGDEASKSSPKEAPTVIRKRTPEARTGHEDTPLYPSGYEFQAALSKKDFGGDSGTYTATEPVFPIAAACEAIRQAAQGLQHAHEFGLVHRDIKPANLMLDRDGTIKILDLGLGKFLDEQRTPGENTSLTMAGTTIGTIDYISPEQCENAGDVDIRADLYSLGCTFFFLLTGRALYSGSRYETTRKKLMAHIVGEIPRLRKIFPDAPAELEAVLEKMLAKDPADRYQTPREVAEALAPFASEDALLDLVDGSHAGLPRRQPGSTGRISGTSDTRQGRALSGERLGDASKPSRPLWRRLLAPVVLLLFLALLMPGLALVRKSFLNPEEAADIRERLYNRGKRNTVEPPPVEAVTGLRVAVRTDLALLPGLNGAWWFDETPWYLPALRELLVRKIDDAGDRPEGLKGLMGEDPEFYYAPNVPEVEARLWKIVQKHLVELPEHQQEIVQKIRDRFGAGLEAENPEECYQTCLDLLLAGHAGSESWSGVEMHTRSLLEHRLATLRNDRELAVTASRRYENALALYRKESQETRGDEETQATPKAARSRLLAFLCLSDAARLEYLATGSYKDAIKKFAAVLKDRQPNDRLCALFRAELNSAHGTLCAEAGEYNDALFTDAREWLDRSKLRNSLHPLAAQLQERYAWSLLDQWKLKDAADQFSKASAIRYTNLHESKNRFAVIPLLHDLHGLALTYRYLGNSERAIEEYRRTLDAITPELAACLAISPEAVQPEECNGLRRYHVELRARAANTRERLADCFLYGGAASGLFGPARLDETAKLYGEAAEYYDYEGARRAMRGKQAVTLLLQNKIDEAAEILRHLEEDKRKLLGDQSRPELIRQLAGALLEYQRGKKAGNVEKGRNALRQFLGQFLIPTNPVFVEAERRESLELRLLCAEFLVDEALDADDNRLLTQEIGGFVQLTGFYTDSKRIESRAYLRRTVDQIVRIYTRLYEANPDQPEIVAKALFQGIVRLLTWMRQSNTPEVAADSLLLFFLTEDPADGFVLFYPMDERPGKLYRLPLKRSQIKSGTRKQGDAWRLDPELVKAVQEEREAGRVVLISWSDVPSWARPEDALIDADWPFDEIGISEQVNE